MRPNGQHGHNPAARSSRWLGANHPPYLDQAWNPPPRGNGVAVGVGVVVGVVVGIFVGVGVGVRVFVGVLVGVIVGVGVSVATVTPTMAWLLPWFGSGWLLLTITIFVSVPAASGFTTVLIRIVRQPLSTGRLARVHTTRSGPPRWLHVNSPG